MTTEKKVFWRGQISGGPSIHKMVESLSCYQDISGDGYTAGPILVSFGIIPMIKTALVSATHLHTVIVALERCESYNCWNIRCEFTGKSLFFLERIFDLEYDSYGNHIPVNLDIDEYRLNYKNSFNAVLYQLVPTKGK